MEFFLSRTELQRNFELVIHLRMKVWVPVAHGCLLRHELDMTNGKSPSHSKNQEEPREIKGIPETRSPKAKGGRTLEWKVVARVRCW